MTMFIYQASVSSPLALLPPHGAQRRPGMAVLVMRGGHFHLIALLSHASRVFLIRLGLDARRDRARLHGIGADFIALLEEGADHRVACGDQGEGGVLPCEMGVLPVSCHAGLLVDREPWALATVTLPSSGSEGHEAAWLRSPCPVPIVVTTRADASRGTGPVWRVTSPPNAAVTPSWFQGSWSLAGRSWLGSP